MTTEAEACIERLDYLRNEVKKELQGLNAEALNWKPAASDTNSIYAIATHIAGTEAGWIHQFVGNIETNRDRDAEFAASGASIADLEALLDRTGEITRLAIGKLSSEDLSTEKAPGQGRDPISYRWAVLHTIEHLGQHLGHLSLTKQLYETAHGR